MASLIINIPFSPIAFQLGPVAIRWYGVCYAVAFLVGLWVASRYLKRYELGDHDYGDLAFWSIIIGLVLARLYYVVQSDSWFYLTHPSHILAFWEGGMAYFGPLFGIPIFIFLYCRWKKLPLWPVLDAAALFAAVGQPIGRIGNIINGDVIGYPSNLPWATSYTNPLSFVPVLGVPYQPAAAYELLIGLGILVILLLLRGRTRSGALFLTYLALYAISQFGIFFLRQNDVIAWGLKQAQFSAIALAAITIVLWLIWNFLSTPHLPSPTRGEASTVEESSVEDPTAEQSPVEETIAEESPIEETPAEEIPAEEPAAAEFLPQEPEPEKESLTESSTAESSAAETPSVETPAESAPAEKPAAETPAEPAGESSPEKKHTPHLPSPAGGEESTVDE